VQRRPGHGGTAQPAESGACSNQPMPLCHVRQEGADRRSVISSGASAESRRVEQSHSACGVLSRAQANMQSHGHDTRSLAWLGWAPDLVPPEAICQSRVVWWWPDRWGEMRSGSCANPATLARVGEDGLIRTDQNHPIPRQASAHRLHCDRSAACACG
jgi:hypothetical protein